MALIPPIPHDIFKTALRRSQKGAKILTGKSKQGTIKLRELYRVELIGNIVTGKLDAVHQNTADFNALPPFQQDMAGVLVDLGEVKRALHSVKWAAKKIHQMSNTFRSRMRHYKELTKTTDARKKFEARVQSILKKVEKDLDVLQDARKKLAAMPRVKDMATVLIAGYPNVGKSSLLKTMSGHKVDIQPYPFTTKKLLIGYTNMGFKRLQLVDSPGILDREQMNPVEKQASLALKHLSGNVLFVLDPSETCGYSLKDQKKFLAKVRKQADNVLVVANKVDLGGEKVRGAIQVNANSEQDVKELKEKLFKLFYKP